MRAAIVTLSELGGNLSAADYFARRDAYAPEVGGVSHKALRWCMGIVNPKERSEIMVLGNFPPVDFASDRRKEKMLRRPNGMNTSLRAVGSDLRAFIFIEVEGLEGLSIPDGYPRPDWWEVGRG